MSYNIRLGIADDGTNSWDIRKNATPAMLMDVRPSVFGVQEAHDFQIAFILEQCPQYKAVGVGREDGVSEGEHMSVFYDTTRISLLEWGTYWLSETPDVPSLGWDAWCKRTATWAKLRDINSGNEFFFVNTHLDHRGVVARKEGLSMIYKNIKKMNPNGYPMVLTGDFNVLPDNDGLTDINALMESARFNAADADSIGSFNGFGSEGAKLRPIDYIYFSGFDKCLRFKVDTTSYSGIPYISDHYPIFADLEFKSAAGGFPGSFWETYSAFGNTDGGIIVLGIKEKNNKFFPDKLSLEQIATYKKQYWDDVNNRTKVSICLTQDKDVIDTEFEGSAILVVRIPRAIYTQRPVYLTLNPFGHTFVRRHEGDYLLDDDGVRTMFADSQAKSDPLDRKIVRNFKLGDDIDLTTVRQYRQVFKGKHDDHPWNQLDDIDFLTKIGAYEKDKETVAEGFTFAGVLVFGTWQGILDALPNYYIDYRERLSSDPAVRWTDRVYPDGYWEPNLYQFYTRVYMKMYSALPVPFKLENGSRVDDTPAHKALREAIVNTIVHSNFFLSSTITIDRYPDRLVFANPGSMLVSVEQYFEGGTSVCRNATIQKIFGFIGGGERAGSGADTIAKGWEFNHWPKPQIREKYDPDRVELTLMIGGKNRVSTNPKTSLKTSPKKGKETREEIIRIIRGNPAVSASEIAVSCKLTKAGIKYHLSILREQGILSHSPEKKGGYWIINE